MKRQEGLALQKRFVHRGSAIALSGHIVRVDEDRTGWPVPAQAASLLTVSGGEAKASIKKYALTIEKPRSANLILVRGLETSCRSVADLAGKTALAKVEASLQSLAVDGGFTTGPCVARLDSIHGPKDRYPNIIPGDCTISDLKLGSSVLSVTIDPEPFQEAGTKAKLAALYRKSKAFRKEHGRRFNTSETQTDIAEFRGGIYVASLVKSMNWKTAPHPDVTLDGYTIIWKGFGRICVGEILISEFYRRLTMLRMSLGSPVEGDCALVEVETNGNFMP